MPAAKKAVFFDRDDTLIFNVPYNGNPDLVELMPGALDACRLLKAHGFELFIISNQSGVGRGCITEQQVDAVNQRVLQLFGEGIFTDVYCCYDTPDDPPDCRKPSPKMIVQAAEDYQLDLPSSFMVGDKKSDVEAGINAGCHSILFVPPHSESQRALSDSTIHFSSSSLMDIAHNIIHS